MSVTVLFREPLLLDALVDRVGQGFVDGTCVEWLLLGVPLHGAVAGCVDLAGKTPALVEEISETVTLALARGTQVLGTFDNEHAVCATVPTGALVGNSAFVPDGDAQHVDVVAIRKLNSTL
jgi:hypothetical protein